jgi:hypothetical protein
MLAPPGSLRQKPSTEIAVPATQGSRTNGNFPRRTPVRDLHMASKLPYLHEYITKSCRQRAEVIQNHKNANIRNIGQGEARQMKYKRLKLGGGQAYDRSSDSTAVVAGATEDRA